MGRRTLKKKMFETQAEITRILSKDPDVSILSVLCPLCKNGFCSGEPEIPSYGSEEHAPHRFLITKNNPELRSA